ncbi:MAG TPA: hypothetical protein VK561_09920, partial [Bradyrhizobium sp.]|nr:hypothetical protein [Bradyrhizobium sp.]
MSSWRVCPGQNYRWQAANSTKRPQSPQTDTPGGLECLVSTGGIGEHSKEKRQQICNRLRWLGVAMDPSANDQAKQCIGARTSEVDILIIPTSEATTIARHCSAK